MGESYAFVAAAFEFDAERGTATIGWIRFVFVYRPPRVVIRSNFYCLKALHAVNVHARDDEAAAAAAAAPLESVDAPVASESPREFMWQAEPLGRGPVARALP